MTDKLELKSSHEVIDTVSVADVDSIFQGKPTDPDILTVVMKGGRRLYCDEVCPVDSLQEEPVSEQIDFEKELYKAFGQVKDFTLGMRIAKWFYDMGKNSQEPVSDDLRCEYRRFLESRRSTGYTLFEVAEHFANWQKEQMMAKAVEGDITFDYYGDDDKIYGCIAHNSFCLEDFGLKDRDKVKMILIKEG